MGAARLLDYDRFVVTRKLPPPDGFPDPAAFNAALADVAASHPTLHRAPLSHATAAGLHSGSLLIDAPPAVAALQQALRGAVADYCRALPDTPAHPFVGRQPRSAFFDVWCVVMERGGHQSRTFIPRRGCPASTTRDCPRPCARALAPPGG